MSHDFNRPEDRLAYIEAHGAEAYNAEMLRFRQSNVIEVCHGHELTRVQSRFGQLIEVGATERAFLTLEQARKCAEENPA